MWLHSLRNKSNKAGANDGWPHKGGYDAKPKIAGYRPRQDQAKTPENK